MEKRTVFARFPRSGERAAWLAACAVIVGLGGCANRGMHAFVARDSGSDVVSDAMKDATTMDAPEEHPTNCTARFSFEDGTVQGAMINSANPNAKAFTSISNSGAVTLCGSGALEIDATFMGATGMYVAGEVDLPLNGNEDLTGKTLTVNVRVQPVPAAPRSISFFVILTTSSPGYSTVPGYPLSLSKDQWYTGSYTFPGDSAPDSDGGADGGGPSDGGPRDSGPLDGSVPGMSSVYGLALEAFLYNADPTVNYKIYVDEIDIR